MLKVSFLMPPKQAAKSVMFRVMRSPANATNIRIVQFCNIVTFISISFRIPSKLSNQSSRIIDIVLNNR